MFEPQLDDPIRSCNVDNIIDLNKCLLQVYDEDVKPFIAKGIAQIYIKNHLLK